MVGTVVGLLNRVQTSSFKKILHSDEHAKFIDKRADARIAVAMERTTEVLDDTRKRVDGVREDIKLTSALLSERLGVVDAKAQKAHDRLDLHLEEGKA